MDLHAHISPGELTIGPLMAAVQTESHPIDTIIIIIVADPLHYSYFIYGLFNDAFSYTGASDKIINN
jgi:hypothetical protein